MCISFVYTLLKVVIHYNLSFLSMSVIDFQKKRLDRDVGGVVRSSFVGCFESV